ncbi:transposase [Candidatus Symbiopectobacterium sp. NZEC127]|uniref:transposase n=2 Tax=unclassified Symbiopectobacterium TaxID=2794573 RepID=UPI002226E797|nr:transposase [Candidatus Symbiopectobacterium sp. NZEC127]MCW2488850.1 transposase [Candidatus Symbiopectobacterium sp. NZEC127]
MLTKATIEGLRELLLRYDQLSRLSSNICILEDIPEIKRKQLALEGMSLDAASMVDMEAKKRYVVTLSLIQRQLARITDDLCNVFCKQMAKVQHRAAEELGGYLSANQDKTDEIIRRFAQLDTVLKSEQSIEEQIACISQLVSARQDLCEFSQIHAEHGGKNESRFMWRHFKTRRTQIFRILSKLTFVATRQDQSFVQVLAFVLANKHRHSDWLRLGSKENGILTARDLDRIPDKWWGLVTGETKRNNTPHRLNRRALEVCVCRQLVSADICVPGGDSYSDTRTQLLPMEKCTEIRAEYGELVGLPVEGKSFVGHLQTRLKEVADSVDRGYMANSYFTIINDRPVLIKLVKKPLPAGFNAVNKTLTTKLQALNLSVLDALGDTMHWLKWGQHFGPLSGHESKRGDEEYRQILTTFAYGTGLGTAQLARNITGVGERQISFLNQRHVTEEKLDAAIRYTVNGYKRFWLPGLWGDPGRAAADGTKWDIYENNILSEYHIRYGGWGGVAYYHVSDTDIALFSHFIPCGVWEAIYILDGLISDIQPDTVHGDTQAQNAVVFWLAYLLGIRLMSRIRNWKDLKCYKSSSEQTYQHIQALFSKDNIDRALIERHLPDMLQVAQSVKAGYIAPSTILRKLGTASRKNKLYFAFRELGRVIRTLFLLEYVSSEELRRMIQGQQINVKVLINLCSGFILQPVHSKKMYGISKLKIIKYNHLIANLLIFHNCHSMTKALKELQSEGMELARSLAYLTNSFIRTLSSTLYKHGYALAATLLRRLLVEDAINQAKSKYYSYAVSDMKKAIDYSEDLEDGPQFPGTESYLRTLYEQHKRKTSLWPLMAEKIQGLSVGKDGICYKRSQS